MVVLWLLLAVFILGGGIAVLYSGAIPTPIPEHVAMRGGEIWGQPPAKTLYQIVLVLLAITLGVGTLILNPGGLVAFFVAGIMIWLFMEDIQKTLIDIWNADFYAIRLPSVRSWRD
jgi:hypothetical protein